MKLGRNELPTRLEADPTSFQASWQFVSTLFHQNLLVHIHAEYPRRSHFLRRPDAATLETVWRFSGGFRARISELVYAGPHDLSV